MASLLAAYKQKMEQMQATPGDENSRSPSVYEIDPPTHTIKSLARDSSSPSVCQVRPPVQITFAKKPRANAFEVASDASRYLRPRTSAFKSVSGGPHSGLHFKTTKSRGPHDSAISKPCTARENAITSSARIKKQPTGPKVRNGSTFQGGKDPFHAVIVAYGEPTRWTQRRAEEARFRNDRDVPTTEPPNPLHYDGLPFTPAQTTSGVDVNLESMDADEFWSRLEIAWLENQIADAEDSKLPWEFGGELRRGVPSQLRWERWEEEEKEDEALYRKMNEVEAWGG